MVLTLIYHVIKKVCKAIIDVAAWLLVALSLWIPLVYTVIFVVWCGLAGKSLSALSTIYWAGLAITFVGSFFVSAFMYERRANAKSKGSQKSVISNAESVKYKSETAELKKSSNVYNTHENQKEPYDELAHKNLNAEYSQTEMNTEEENKLKQHIQAERERLKQQEELGQNRPKFTKEDLLKAKQQGGMTEGAFGHHPNVAYQSGHNQPQNPYGFAPYNSDSNPNPQPFINPYTQNYKSNPFSQANNPYNQPNNPNYQQSGYTQQNNYGFAPYNANPYLNQQNFYTEPQKNYNTFNNHSNPYGFESYDPNPYKIKENKSFNDNQNPYDSFYNQGDASYKVFDRQLGDDITLNSERQQTETPKIFAVKSDPTVFIHEYKDRLEYYKRTRQGMIFMKAVDK